MTLLVLRYLMFSDSEREILWMFLSFYIRISNCTGILFKPSDVYDFI